ncbi:MAG TPA: phage tail protein [Methylophilaceae bacterium]
MLPQDGELSTTAAISGFAYPVKGPLPEDKLQDWELAGVALNDPSQGLMVKVWHAFATHDLDTDVVTVWVEAPGVPATELFSGVGITEIALAFDQNMNPFVAYHQGDDAKIYWYDPTIPGMTHTTLPSGIRTMRCTMDERRSAFVADSDIILAYIRDGNFCIRYQRERYEVEHVMRTGVGARCELVSMARNLGNRIQWRFRNYENKSDPNALLSADPFLADVVADLLRRSGVKPEHIDTSELWVPIEGYRIANEGGADSNIAPLQAAWFFDPGEWDKKLRFVMRGGEPVAHLTYDDLLERHEDRAFKVERVQEIELLRKVNVTMIDSTAGWVPNKQTAERRSATIKAVGESSTVFPITAKPDFAATVALKRLRVPWGEPHKFTYALGTRWSALTPTDVVTYTDQRGRKFVMRLAQLEEDYGRITIQANSNATWVYKQTAIGTAAPPSIPTVPAQAGDTVILPLDIPVLRDQDDELGYYIAVYGTGEGWGGGLLQISLDGGATVLQSLDVTVPASVGETVTALAPEVSSEYLSEQVLRITIPETPESISYAELLRYRNLAAVQRADGSWEVLQWQTATQVSENVYDLSGLVRGRYATSPDAVPAGAAFVILDASVLFLQVQQWMVGQTISYRGITYNQNADDVPWKSFVATSPKSQEEWPVHMVRAERDGSNNVTVSWVGRARLGVEVSPHHSKYFGGYRVMFSDGFAADTTNTTYTRASTPPGVTITVAPINTITGLGPASEGITV